MVIMEWWGGGGSSYEVGGTLMIIEIVEWYFEWVTNHVIFFDIIFFHGLIKILMLKYYWLILRNIYLFNNSTFDEYVI